MKLPVMPPIKPMLAKALDELPEGELALEPIDCVAIEDSANGMTSALEAGVRCVAIPEAATRNDPRFDSATWRLDSLRDVVTALELWYLGYVDLVLLQALSIQGP